MATPKLLFLITSFCTFILTSCSQPPTQFIYNGFKQNNLHLDGIAKILPNGLLQFTNSSQQQKGHAFFPHPLRLSASHSLSTTFVFAMLPEAQPSIGGHGMAFVASPSMDFKQTLPNEQLGLFNNSNNGLFTNHVFAVELDTVQSPVFGDIDSNHVGIDVNSLNSTDAASAKYYSRKSRKNVTLDLLSGNPMQVWIDYDAKNTIVEVVMAPLGEPKPMILLLSTKVNLSEIILDTFYVGFSAATGTLTGGHYLIGWSFNQNGEAESFDISKLPEVPKPRTSKKFHVLDMILLCILLVLLVSFVGLMYRVKRKKYEEVREDWEKEYAVQRFAYKDLYKATKGFKEGGLLGFGGFGKVYKGILPSTKFEVAIKKVSHDSRQGMKEFVAETASMRRLRHRNLVPLLGYCRRQGELLLVYEYMSNGSLDKILFDKEKPVLSWQQRLKIIKGVACALYYLHEEWEQVVLHRDVKASNILLDGEMDARLGDFGLARLYDHGTNPQTTHVVGTVGYLAPELPKTGKATTSTDVFSFGTFILEVACGRRPIEPECRPEQVILVDWVHECWMKGSIVETSDPRLEGNYDAEEMTRILKLGLMCSHPNPKARLSIRQAMQFIDGHLMLPELPLELVEIGSFNQSVASSSSWFSEKAFSSHSHSASNVTISSARKDPMGQLHEAE